MQIHRKIVVGLFAVSLAACASTPTEPKASAAPVAAPAIAAKAAPAVAVAGAPKPEKSAVTMTFSAPLVSTHAAAIAAAKESGFDIATDTDTYVAGPRPRKIGVFVGSGGETINITFKSLGEASTEVTVWTKRTFVGGAGQKDWDAPVLDAMKASLAAK